MEKQESFRDSWFISGVLPNIVQKSLRQIIQELMIKIHRNLFLSDL